MTLLIQKKCSKTFTFALQALFLLCVFLLDKRESMAASLRSVEATRSSTMARLVSVKPATAGRHRLAPAPEAARGRGVVFRRIANSSRDFHEKRGTGRQVRVKQTARRLASVSTRMAAEEPRTGPKMDQKKVRPMEILEHPLFPFPPSPTRYTSHERIGYAPMPMPPLRHLQRKRKDSFSRTWWCIRDPRKR